MTLVKIKSDFDAPQYFNMDFLVKVLVGEIVADKNHQPIPPQKTYSLYFAGLTDFVTVSEPDEVAAFESFLKFNSRPLVNPEGCD
jgi:hypothetical protein